MSNPYGPPTTPSSIQPKPHLQSMLPARKFHRLNHPRRQSTGIPILVTGGLARKLETPVAGSWWRGGANDATTINTPKAATFLSVQDDMVQASSDGFISLMDNQSFAFESKPPSRQATSSSAIDTLNDEEDLGFGNSKAKPKEGAERTENSAQENTSPVTSSAENGPGKHATTFISIYRIPSLAPAVANGGGSWFGRLFRRSDNTSTGPVKANLGEENSLYYDKELKRWINTKVAFLLRVFAHY
jgi:hypothetical protein